jgi:HPt (histidine-containing phosphotransfer) domain-containing protein
LLESLGGDEGLARKTATAFVTIGAQQVHAIAEAISAADWVTVRELAHSLRGAALSLRASLAAAAAAGLEDAAAGKQRALVPGLFDKLKTEIGRIVAYFQPKTT